MKQVHINNVTVNGSSVTVSGMYDTDGDTLLKLRLDAWMDERNTGNITNTSPDQQQQIQIHSDDHDLRKADWISVAHVKGTTEANGLWQIAIVSPAVVVLEGSLYEHVYAGNTGGWTLVRAPRRPHSYGPAQAPPAWEVTITLTRKGWYSLKAAGLFKNAPHVAASLEHQIASPVG